MSNFQGGWIVVCALLAGAPAFAGDWPLLPPASGHSWARTSDIIKAGNRLYLAGDSQICALGLEEGSAPPEKVWSVPVERDVQRLLAAGGRLFAVTLDGAILCYGARF